MIKLLDYLPFKTKVTLDKLIENEIVEPNSGPRPFERITREQYETIYKIGMEEK